MKKPPFNSKRAFGEHYILSICGLSTIEAAPKRKNRRKSMPKDKNKCSHSIYHNIPHKKRKIREIFKFIGQKP
jgi:hypothetical protein